MFEDIEETRRKLDEAGYVAERRLAATVFLASKLEKPLLVEGPAGVGKTELAKAIATSSGMPFIRLQCYEGLDETKALYEWNYQKQLLYIQSLKEEATLWKNLQKDIYSKDFLLARPLLVALTCREKPILLIDELDKSDDEFESFLLEALSEYQVTIPEYGTLKAEYPPFAVLTSNNRRSLSDALKRRCLYLYINYPDLEQEKKIIELKVPGINDRLAEQLVKFVQSVRKMNMTGKELRKAPGISETIDWAKALLLLQVKELDRETVSGTLSVLLKYQEDVELLEKRIAGLIDF